MIVKRYIKNNNLGISLNLNISELKIGKKNNAQNTEKNKDNLKQDLNLIKNNLKEEEKKEDEECIGKNINNKNPVNKLTFIKSLLDKKNVLNYLYKSTPKSRFHFANPDLGISEISSIIPSQMNEFITQLFVKHSIFYKEEQNDFSQYYFSLKPNSLDSNDSWSSLISTLKKWNDLEQNEDADNINRFNTF